MQYQLYVTQAIAAGQAGVALVGAMVIVLLGYAFVSVAVLLRFILGPSENGA